MGLGAAVGGILHGRKRENLYMEDKAVLSNDEVYTSFAFNGHVIRFKASPRLEKYTEIIEWDHGYLVVTAKCQGHEEEEYIDLIPILKNLYFDPDEFLEPIKGVRIEYV